MAGNLEIMDSVSGAGSVQVSGSPGQAGHLAWINGTLSVAQMSVNSGGTLVIAGRARNEPTPVRLPNQQLRPMPLAEQPECGFRRDLGQRSGRGAGFTGGHRAYVRQSSSYAGAEQRRHIYQIRRTNVTTLAADFKNTGSFQVKNGTVNFQGFWVQNVGNTVVDSGAVLAADTVKILGGRLSGNGTVNALVNNAAVVSPGSSPGTLSTAPGKDYQQTSFGTLAIEIGGRTPGVQFDRLAVGGNATLAGRLQVSLSNGFTPQLGDSFDILTCQNETGVFANIDPTGIPSTFWLPRYNGTNVVLILAQNIILSPASIVGNSLKFSFQTGSGLPYRVEFSDSMGPPDWQLFETFIGDGSIHTVTDSLPHPQRFYRVGY